MGNGKKQVMIFEIRELTTEALESPHCLPKSTFQATVQRREIQVYHGIWAELRKQSSQFREPEAAGIWEQNSRKEEAMQRNRSRSTLGSGVCG